jgi:hypothetical protein
MIDLSPVVVFSRSMRNTAKGDGSMGGNKAVRAERTLMTKEVPLSGTPVYRSQDRASRAMAKFALYHRFMAKRY